MGILGEILGAAAGAAIDGIAKGINNSITESNLENASYVGLLFDYNYIPFHETEIRNSALQGTLIQTGTLLGVDVTRDNYGTLWNYYATPDVNGDESWDGFVLRANGYSVIFGLYGMAQCAMTIEGNDCGYYAKQIKQVLEINQFDNVRFCFEEIPFHEKTWMRIALEELAIGSSEKKKKKNKVTIDSGDASIGSVLLKKIDEICKRRLDDIFNPDTFSFEKENDDHYHILTDGNISIEFNSEYTSEYEEKSVYLEYSKGEKSISLSFDSYEVFVDLELVSGDADFDVSIDDEDEEIHFENALKLIEAKKVDVPENFYDTVMDFIKALYTLASKMHQLNQNTQMINDVLSQEVLHALEILELSEETCSVEEIKKAYRNLSKEYHPDMMQGLTGKMKQIAEEKMQELRDAYEFLIEFFKED